MSEEFEELVDSYRIRDFHGFNHDMNPAHNLPPHSLIITLSILDSFYEKLDKKDAEQKEKELREARAKLSGWELKALEDRLEEEYSSGAGQRRKEFEAAAEDVLIGCKVISPGMLHVGLLEHQIPANMIVAGIKTKFEAQPLYVAIKGEGIVLRGTKSEEPFAVEEKETPGVVYKFTWSGPNLRGDAVELQDSTIIAFPDSVPTEEIFRYFIRKFEKMMAEKRRTIDQSGKQTDITEDHDDYYWSSIRPSSLPYEADLPMPVRRGASVSQLEMLAKVPRILSLHRARLEKKLPDLPHYMDEKPAAEPYVAYAELEKSHGLVEDVQKRARQLANQLKYIYARQKAIFDPRVKCKVGDKFDLTTHLTRYKKGFHLFTSELVLPAGCAYVDESSVLVNAWIPERIMEFLYEKRINLRTLERFK